MASFKVTKSCFLLQLTRACNTLGYTPQYIQILRAQFSEATKLLGHMMEKYWGKEVLGNSFVHGSTIAVNSSSGRKSEALNPIPFAAMKGE